MLKTLIAVRFRAMLSAMFKGSKKAQSRSLVVKGLFGLLAVYVLACFVFLFGIMFYSLYGPLKLIRMTTLYFAIAGFMALFLSFIGTVFATQSQIYDAKDNELLLAMPIAPIKILVSRMIVLYLTNLMFTLLVMLPAGVIYWINESIAFGAVASFALGCLLIPLGALTISCVLGWVFAWIGSKMRNKNLITLVATVAFLAAYFFFIGQSEKVLQILLEHYAEVARFLQGAGYPVWQLGLAITRLDAWAFVKFVLCMIVPYAVVMYVLSKSFVGIATRRKGVARIKYQRRAMKVSSVRRALLIKELRHLGASAMWMLNGGIGLAFMLALPVMFMVNNETINILLELVPFAKENMSAIIGAIQCMLLSMCTISAATVSLEGKNLWISQSIPVDASTVLESKAGLQIAVSVPFVLVASVMTWIAMPGGVLDNIIVLILPLAFAVVMSLMGAAINVRFPKFNWTSETVAVKQGASIIADMGAGFALIATPAAVYAIWLTNVMSANLFALIMIAGYAGFSLLMLYYLRHGGRKRYMNL